MDMSISKNAIANLEWYLRVDCPSCGASNDLNSGEHDSEHRIAKFIFNNQWNNLDGWEVACEYCGEEFTLDRVEI